MHGRDIQGDVADQDTAVDPPKLRFLSSSGNAPHPHPTIPCHAFALARSLLHCTFHTRQKFLPAGSCLEASPGVETQMQEQTISETNISRLPSESRYSPMPVVPPTSRVQISCRDAVSQSLLVRFQLPARLDQPTATLASTQVNVMPCWGLDWTLPCFRSSIQTKPRNHNGRRTLPATTVRMPR
jgi:hypothetical protein